MILDNLTRAFKTQNWFAVATEFVIVIAGVVIGFQIQAWNEGRAERALGETYKALIVGEIERQLDAYESMARGATSVAQWVEIVAAAINDPESVRDDPDRFISAVYFSRYRSYRDTQRIIYDGMESSGRIALIEDEEAVEVIRAFYRRVSGADSILVNDWNPWSRYNIAMEGYLTSDQITAIQVARNSGTEHNLFSGDEAVALATRMRQNPEVIRLVRSVNARHALVQDFAESGVEDATSALASLGSR